MVSLETISTLLHRISTEISFKLELLSESQDIELESLFAPLAELRNNLENTPAGYAAVLQSDYLRVLDDLEKLMSLCEDAKGNDLIELEKLDSYYENMMIYMNNERLQKKA